VLAFRRIFLLALCIAGSLLGPAAARADSLDLNGFRFTSPLLFVHDRDGAAVITVVRSNTTTAAQVRYGAWHLTADPYRDYTPVGGRLDFAAGQAAASFSIPIINHGIAGLPRTLRVGLYGAYPIGLGVPSTAVLTIINDDQGTVMRDPMNPLGLAGAPPSSNPLSGAQLFVDRVWGLASRQAAAWRNGHPQWAGLLNVIASQPETHRFGRWDGNHPGLVVQRYLERASAQQPGTVPLISTYGLTHGCGRYSDSPAQEASYDGWISSFAHGIGARRAVVFLEMDSLITAGCLSSRGLRARMRQLRFAISKLNQLPRVLVYLDAGAADALSAARAARLLSLAGVRQIQGFFLNSTHFDWTSREIRYGRAISRRLGGKHFIVSTAANGRGPLVPRSRVRSGNEVLCNPSGRGLGPLPTTNTGFANVDAFVWIGNPGRSGGACVRGAPPTGVFWPEYAMSLVRNADFRVR
jgi:endoglucanase